MHAQHARNFAFFDAPVGLIFSIDRDLERGSWLDYGMFLEAIMVAARHLRREDRNEFLRLIADQLRPRPIDIEDAVKKATAYFAERGLFECSDRSDDG